MQGLHLLTGTQQLGLSIWGLVSQALGTDDALGMVGGKITKPYIWLVADMAFQHLSVCFLTMCHDNVNYQYSSEADSIVILI